MSEGKEKTGLMTKAGPPMRIFLMNSAIIMLIGIWLSGFEKVHWFIYFIPGLFLLSSAIGICPGLNLWRRILKS